MTKTMTKEPEAVGLFPLGDRVLVRPEEPVKQTEGGLYIPDNAQEKSQRGVVVAVGPGPVIDGALWAMPVEVGDTVLFARYGGVGVKDRGTDYLLLRLDDLLARLGS